MKIYRVTATVSGINDVPECQEEEIIADSWTEVHELMARICRDTGYVILEMRIVLTNNYPFSKGKKSDKL